MPLEDFTTYVEVDSGADITVTTNKCNVISMRRVETSSVTKDFGAGFFGNFIHELETEMTVVDVGGVAIIWSLVDFGLSATLEDILADGIGMFSALTSAPAIQLTSRQFFDNDVFGISLSTIYYLRVVRTSTTFQVFIYSDSARTNLLDTLSVTRDTLSRFLGVIGSRDVGGAAAPITYYVQNLNLTPGIVPLRRRIEGY